MVGDRTLAKLPGSCSLYGAILSCHSRKAALIDNTLVLRFRKRKKKRTPIKKEKKKKRKEKDTHKFLGWKVSVPFFVQKDKKNRTPIFSTERFIGALFFVIPSVGL